MSKLELEIRELTTPVGGQYPRPWMTTLADPGAAQVFVVGRNQARAIPESAVTDQDAYLDALFNRGPESCRTLYDRVTGAVPSLTRRNLDALAECLRQHGVASVLETNVVCYATSLSNQLSHRKHRAGAQRGTEIFSCLLRSITPKVIVVHGIGATKSLARSLGVVALLPEPTQLEAPRALTVPNGEVPCDVFVIPSLALPRWNSWRRWAPAYFEQLAEAIAQRLRT